MNLIYFFFYVSEKTLHIRYYWALVGVSWLSAVVFAIPPLFGYGIYSCDPTSTFCSLLWPPVSSARQMGYSVPYVIICGVIPIVGM